ncbi:MAG: hypothetical protein H6839_12550 [Planctomycetes bacterium]|nr:hypothetical protein [Planctomycetota bacterium]
MLKSVVAVLVLLFAAPCVQACWSYVPLEHFVDRSEYVLHLKVVAIEEDGELDSGDGGRKHYTPDYAVCQVKDVLLGLIVTDDEGHVRITSSAKRNESALSTDVSYAVGDEITLVAHSPTIVKGKGMVFNGQGYPSTRESGAPSRRLRKLVQARMDNAYALLDKFDRLVPGKRTEAESAVIEHEDGTRHDYKDLSPEADLLLDLVATNRGAPAEAFAPRRDLDAKTRERLAILALRAICDVTDVAAKAALPLLGGDDHGTGGLLAPGDVSTETALATLQKLDDLGDLGAILPELIRNDVKDRALGWAAHLALKGGYAGKLGEWIWIEHMSSEAGAYKSLAGLIAPEQSRDYPYADKEIRLIARLVDAEAWALVTLFERINSLELPQPVGAQPDVKLHEARVKALAALDTQPAYLAVYTFLRAITGKDNKALTPMRKRIEQEHRYKGDSSVDLDDFADLEWRVRMDYGSVPQALTLAIKNAEK